MSQGDRDIPKGQERSLVVLQDWKLQPKYLKKIYNEFPANRTTYFMLVPNKPRKVFDAITPFYTTALGQSFQIHNLMHAVVTNPRTNKKKKSMPQTNGIVIIR